MGLNSALERLNAVRYLVESDVGFAADCVKLDMLQGREVDGRTKDFAELITRIYTLVHPFFSECRHEDWENENEELIKQASVQD